MQIERGPANAHNNAASMPNTVLPASSSKMPAPSSAMPSVSLPPASLPAPPASTGSWLTLTTLCLAILIAQIDTAVVNLAVHSIESHFRAGITAMQWVLDSYNLVYAVLLLSGGLLADLYGRRRIFMTGMAIFTLASLLCGTAPNVTLLITGRILAGVGAALMTPASLAIIRVAWPDTVQRSRVLGIWAACNGVAFAIAPTLGGLLIQNFGWRSIFFLAIPIGITALALARPSIPESSDPHGRRFDLGAQILGAVALGGLSIAAIEATKNYAAAIAALLTALTALVLFVRVETGKGPAAMVPLDMFQIPAFGGAIIATTGMTFGMYGLLFLLPLTWQSSGLLNPTGAGLALMPMALAFVLVSPYTGTIARKTSSGLLCSGGVALIGCGLLVLGATAGSRSLIAAEIGLVLTGIGMGLATGPLLGAAVGAVPANRSGTASALINVARIAGATLGVAVLGAVYSGNSAGPAGLHVALIIGGLTQIACAAIAWLTMRQPYQQRRPQE